MFKDANASNLDDILLVTIYDKIKENTNKNTNIQTYITELGYISEIFDNASCIYEIIYILLGTQPISETNFNRIIKYIDMFLKRPSQIGGSRIENVISPQKQTKSVTKYKKISKNIYNKKTQKTKNKIQTKTIY